MTKEDLIPIKTTERAKELGRHGGLVRSEAKSQANIFNASKATKCKNCKLNCPIKKNVLKYDPEAICDIPEARAKAIIYNMPIMTSELWEKLTIETLTEMRRGCKDIKDLKMYFDSVMALWNKVYPTVQKNMNMNIELKDEAKSMAKEIFGGEEWDGDLDTESEQNTTENNDNVQVEGKVGENSGVEQI